MQSKEHWEQVYTTKTATSVSWFQEHAQQSIELIRQTGAEKDGGVIDVGGGASTLVDDLLREGYGNLSVLDLSESALSTARQRLGESATLVNWLVGDITRIELPRQRPQAHVERSLRRPSCIDAVRCRFAEFPRAVARGTSGATACWAPGLRLR